MKQKVIISDKSVCIVKGNDSYRDSGNGLIEIKTGVSKALIGFGSRFEFSDELIIKRAKLRVFVHKAGTRQSGRLDVYGVMKDGLLHEFELYKENHHELLWLDAIDIYNNRGNTGWYEVDVTDYISDSHLNKRYIAFKIECETKLKNDSPVYLCGCNSEMNKPELLIEYYKNNDINKPNQCKYKMDPLHGYKLWLDYKTISDKTKISEYRDNIKNIYVDASGDIIDSAVEELKEGLTGLLDSEIKIADKITQGSVVLTNNKEGALLKETFQLMPSLGEEGFTIRTINLNKTKIIVIAALGNKGLLYGAYRFLEFLKCLGDLSKLNISDKPMVKLRMLNHWDNWNGTIERGYAGSSIWNWDDLPEKINPRYRDYVRACASIGINGTVINNVNSQNEFIKTYNLIKVAALADELRKYGIRIFICVPFNCPITLGGINTADPLDERVINWWKRKTREIYDYIPDFGGYVVKGDSESQPGPLQYGRDHSEGANMLANVLNEFGGILIWRAFVYNIKGLDKDRAKQAFQIFKPLDGRFSENVILQVKNGPLDFQVREAVSPIIGGMEKTDVGIELQIAQEYTGQSTHLCWLVPQWKEIFMFDTHMHGANSKVFEIIEGKLGSNRNTLVAGVANTGSDMNWTRHPLSQANWYGFGRLAWNPQLKCEDIADEWVKMTYGTDSDVLITIKTMLMNSWETYESYTSPLGLGYICDRPRHFNPSPETRSNYNGTDLNGLGYDRTKATGSGYVDQYHEHVSKMLDDISTTPEELLLWFHHVNWNYKLKCGRTLIQYMYDSYFLGVEEVEKMIVMWGKMISKIDFQSFKTVHSMLYKQHDEAIVWRNILCRYYFGLSGIKGKQVQNEVFALPEVYIKDLAVKPSQIIENIQVSKLGTIYLLSTERACSGSYEKARRLKLADDGLTGTSARVDRLDIPTKIMAPQNPGKYKLYACDKYGNISLPSDGTVKVLE